MSADVGTRNDLCRVTVIAPTARIDVALPANVPVAEILPTLLRQTGADATGDASRWGRWSLQRFGQAPLDTGLTPTALSILDGEILYLRPRQAELPELAFDDLADAVATATAQGSRRWTGSDTRRAGLSTAAACLVAWALLVLSAGPPWTVPAVTAGAVALALVGLGGVLSRAFSDATAGQLVAFAAVLVAAVAGAGALGGSHRPGGFGAPSLLGASAAGLVTAALGAVVVADGFPGFLGVGVAALLAVAASALDIGTSAHAWGAAALVIVVALGLVPAIPALALRLAELPLPSIPFTADDVRRDNSLVDGADVLRRAVVADATMTGLLGAVAGLVVAAQALLSTRDRSDAAWLMALSAMACALRARSFVGRRQRGFLLAAAVSGGLLLVLRLAPQESGVDRLLLLAVPLLLVSAVPFLVALRLPEHPVSPVWRRAADILDGLVVVSLVPVALGVLGTYSYLRGLAG
jgi:type VII secretion integral membrane protein EccD